ncbi:MAG: hypothetical protein WCK98_04155 [bacterium]
MAKFEELPIPTTNISNTSGPGDSLHKTLLRNNARDINPAENSFKNEPIESTEELKSSLEKQIFELAEKIEVYKLSLESQINRLTHLRITERKQITDIAANLSSRITALTKINLSDDLEALQRVEEAFDELLPTIKFLNQGSEKLDIRFMESIPDQSDELNLATTRLEQQVNLDYELIQDSSSFIRRLGFPLGYTNTIIDNFKPEDIDSLYSQIARLPSDPEKLIAALQVDYEDAQTQLERNKIAQLCLIINLDRENITIWLRDYFSNYLPITSPDADQYSKPSTKTQEIISSKRKLYQLIASKYSSTIPEITQIHENKNLEKPEIRDLFKKMCETEFLSKEEAVTYGNIPSIMHPDFPDWYKSHSKNKDSEAPEHIAFKVAAWEKFSRMFQDYGPATIEIRSLIQAQLKGLLENGSTQIPSPGTFIEYLLRSLRNVDGSIPKIIFDEKTGQIVSTYYEKGDLRSIDIGIGKADELKVPPELEKLKAIFLEFAEKCFKLAEKCEKFVESGGLNPPERDFFKMMSNRRLQKLKEGAPQVALNV